MLAAAPLWVPAQLPGGFFILLSPSSHCARSLGSSTLPLGCLGRGTALCCLPPCPFMHSLHAVK